ncbi:hypothetical protein GCM10010912_43880 [Paenibacillus albidus]|uniref:Uncharacterized protein n=1 Tax=Paenibacillus albidus TaxID=2041023 RepID=A0A917FQ52_9BACL|nr:hypothetical protein [Paenibacillus albidus]GGF94145.1 hypothetical protein GCM10010912_43880 [Paenibacillus albidus]
MNIRIVRNGLQTNEVYFDSDCGEGRGIWYGEPLAPGQKREVEFELTELLMRWVDILPLPGGGEYGIRLDGAKVVFTGVLENIEEDGTGYLRLGTGLMMFECLGEPMMLGTWVEVKAREVRIYPVAL